MFDRYTEPARRTVFFARYEASQLGGQYIEAGHLLLGILRENKMLKGKLQAGAVEEIRDGIRKQFPAAEKVSTSVDMPLSRDARRALELGAEEAAAMKHDYIDCGHLLLGLLRLQESAAADLLRPYGIEYSSYREEVGNLPPCLPRISRQIDVRAIERPSPWDRENAIDPASASLRDTIVNLRELVDRTARLLQVYPESYCAQRLKRKPWSRQQALGHLADWATTHHQWFARALTESKLIASGYPADQWVTAQNYQGFAWQDLVDVWVSLNRLIVHVLSQIPEEKLDTPCRIGTDEPVPLSQVIARYVEHCGDIAGQIAARL